MYQMLLGLQECHRYRILHRFFFRPSFNFQRPQASEPPHQSRRGVKTGRFRSGSCLWNPCEEVGLRSKFYVDTPAKSWLSGTVRLIFCSETATTTPAWTCGAAAASSLVGCALHRWRIELYNSTPLFPGQNESDEREVIFKKLGSPNLANMPKLNTYPEWNASMQNVYKPRPLSELVPRMDNNALDLLSVGWGCGDVIDGSVFWRMIRSEESIASRHWTILISIMWRVCDDDECRIELGVFVWERRRIRRFLWWMQMSGSFSLLHFSMTMFKRLAINGCELATITDRK